MTLVACETVHQKNTPDLFYTLGDFITAALSWVIDLCIKAYKTLYACKHTHAPLQEGKSFCPDCGTGLIGYWISLRCSGCHIKRPLRLVFGKPFPLHTHCSDCGDAGYQKESISTPKSYQLHKAWLVMEPLPESLEENTNQPSDTHFGTLKQNLKNRLGQLLINTHAWLEPA